MDHLQKGHKEQHTQKCFSSAVDWEELSWPHSRKQQHKGERSNTKKTQLQEETPDKGHGILTKHWRMKSEFKKNCTVGTCHKCSRSLCGMCTAKTRRLRVKGNSPQ